MPPQRQQFAVQHVLGHAPALLLALGVERQVFVGKVAEGRRGAQFNLLGARVFPFDDLQQRLSGALTGRNEIDVGIAPDRPAAGAAIEPVREYPGPHATLRHATAETV